LPHITLEWSAIILTKVLNGPTSSVPARKEAYVD
jgi:hypothetical protein